MDFMEVIKTRLEESKERLAQAQQRLMAANAEVQVAQQDFNSWTWAFQAETRRQEKVATTAPVIDILVSKAETTVPKPTAAPSITAGSNDKSGGPTAGDERNESTQSERTEPNKTELIRELLHAHPGGMTGGELWEAVKGKIPHRPYVYSVLKRLRDREQLVVRRGKYCLRIPQKPEEGKHQVAIQ